MSQCELSFSSFCESLSKSKLMSGRVDLGLSLFEVLLLVDADFIALKMRSDCLLHLSDQIYLSIVSMLLII